MDTYTRERPGVSTFVLEDGVVYHSYSAIRAEWIACGAWYQWLESIAVERTQPASRMCDLWWIKRHDCAEDIAFRRPEPTTSDRRR